MSEEADFLIQLRKCLSEGGNPWLMCCTAQNHFERNQRDEFVVSGIDVGILQRVVMHYDNAGGSGSGTPCGHTNKRLVETVSFAKPHGRPGPWFRVGVGWSTHPVLAT